jgi:hypothetical protein
MQKVAKIDLDDLKISGVLPKKILRYWLSLRPMRNKQMKKLKKKKELQARTGEARSTDSK